MKYYSLDKILSRHAHYNVIIGERSNGKTTAVLDYCLKESCEKNKAFAYIRRYDLDLRASRTSTIFDDLTVRGMVEKYSNSVYTKVVYKSFRFYLARFDEELQQDILSPEPIGYAFSLASYEHDKSTSYPRITTIFFDEFLTPFTYMNDEVFIFENVLSTIIRNRNDVKIFMVGNSLNNYAPYFSEMGITNIKNMKPDTIDVYTYGGSELKVAVEFTGNKNNSKPSDVYFAFNSPKLNMITGTGDIWGFDIFPHLKVKYKPKDVILQYFIKFDNNIFHAEIINLSGNVFTYIHKKTTPIKDDEKAIIYSLEPDYKHNYRTDITKCLTSLDRFIYKFYVKDKIFFQNNTVGMAIQNYLNCCRKK